MRLNLLSLITLPGLALATNQVVAVGSQGLQFLPNTIFAQTGDTIEFQWASPGHSVAQSSYDAPCSPLKGGIYSGTLDGSKMFTITLNNTDPLWIYCGTPAHCQAGMLLVINPPSTGPNLDGFRIAASNAAQGPEPSTVEGGVVASAGSSSSSTTAASGTGSATATATATGASSTAKSGARNDVVVSGIAVFAGLIAWAV